MVSPDFCVNGRGVQMSFTRISRNAVAIVLAAGIIGLTLYAAVATAGIALVAIANFARLLLA